MVVYGGFRNRKSTEDGQQFFRSSSPVSTKGGISGVGFQAQYALPDESVVHSLYNEGNVARGHLRSDALLNEVR